MGWMGGRVEGWLLTDRSGVLADINRKRKIGERDIAAFALKEMSKPVLKGSVGFCSWRREDN